MTRRLQLHEELCKVLGCSTRGEECRVYFQPPPTVRMKYPAIVYSLDDIDGVYANNLAYLSHKKYTVTVIDRNPDTDLIEKMTALPLCQFNKSFINDNLNHFVFEIYY